MQPVTRVLSLAASILLAAMPAAALADEIHAGNWEFTSTTQIPGLPPPPPGSTVQPGLRMNGTALSNTHTACVTGEHPIPTKPDSKCTFDKNDRHGGTIDWTGTCTSPRGDVHAEGKVTYDGDTMNATMTAHLTRPDGKQMDVTTLIAGKYLGPCPG